MKVTTPAEALAALNLLTQDFEMLRNFEWIPDDDSIDASQQVIDLLIKFIKELK
jgi:hypothetical protein